MIEIEIFEKEKHINKVVVNGHSGYADAGEDILCASISALTFTLIESMDSVLELRKDQYSYEVDSSLPLMSLEIYYDKLSDKQRIIADGLTKAYKTGVVKSSEGYNDFIKIVT